MEAPRANSQKSLYRRIGGHDAIAAVVDELFALLRSDPRFSRFGAGRSVDSHMRARQLLVDQICALAGGPCFYIGRDMKSSHAGLGITEEEWEMNLEYASNALKKHGITEPEHSEFLKLFEQHKCDIVEGEAVRVSDSQSNG